MTEILSTDQERIVVLFQRKNVLALNGWSGYDQTDTQNR